MTPFKFQKASPLALLRIGAWLPVVLGVIVTLGLAGLHYYQQELMRRSTTLVRDMGRASNDLAIGFVHFTLGGGPDSPWQRERGIALVTQALDDFERAAMNSSASPQVVADFRWEMNRFRALLQQAAQAQGPMSERETLELRLALHQVGARASRLDRTLLTDLSQLRFELGVIFGAALLFSLLLLGSVFLALYASRRRSMAALRMLESLSSISTDAIFAKDRQGRYLLFNQEGSRIAGLSVQQVIGRDDWEVFPAEQAAHLVANDRRVMQEKTTRTYEEEVRTIEGPRVFLSTKGPLLDRDGEVVGVFGISKDITERKAAEQALQQSQAQLEAVIESLNEGLLLTSPKGEFVRANRAGMEMYGLNAASAQDLKRMGDVFEVTTLDGVRLPLRDWPLARVLRGEHLKDLELRVRRLDSDWSAIHSFGGRLLRSEDGRPFLALVMATDVTQRHKAEESLRRTQRMEALGELAAGIAHDFNNLLMAMSGNARLAEEELPSGHAARECLREIVRAGGRASDLVRSILLFARAEEPMRRTVHLGPLIEEALTLVRPTAPPKIRFIADLDAQTPPVSIDPSQFHQVIVNLVTNSIYAIAHGPHANSGVLEVSLKRAKVDADDATLAASVAPGDYVRISVADNGCGMDQHTLSKLFNPFFTTKPAGQGTGLGMPVVHGIVRNHEGAINVRSQLGEGTTVDVYLPAAVGAVAEPELTPTAEAQLSPKRVLYVDDEEALVFLAERYLGKRGHKVTGFVDPGEAVRAFAAQPQAFDVVITDMSMPTMSGFDVARSMLSTRPDAVIFMMSGYVRAEDREAALALGVKDLLLKPSSIDELADAVDRQIA